MAAKGPKETKRSSDAAVKAKTGKVWAEWFKILDTAGAKKWAHKEIAGYLFEKRKLPGWWAQMVAVGYEHERGMRDKFQNCNGDFAANSSRTLVAPAGKVYEAWTDEKIRRRWLQGANLEITKATKGKSIRAKCDGDTRLSVYFYPSGGKKTRVAVDHMKLGTSKDVLKMKSFWFEALNRLESLLVSVGI
ncbi:MAG TPA: hypothetical protein VNV84_04910 [Candidatus Acidoferrales bacterium]|jgi:hypothetical protein|nr:hypothetical protein [Candidatus Acidoferrales bacterium]